MVQRQSPFHVAVVEVNDPAIRIFQQKLSVDEIMIAVIGYDRTDYYLARFGLDLFTPCESLQQWLLADVVNLVCGYVYEEVFATARP